jgi:hypothetical protein
MTSLGYCIRIQCPPGGGGGSSKGSAEPRQSTATDACAHDNRRKERRRYGWKRGLWSSKAMGARWSGVGSNFCWLIALSRPLFEQSLSGKSEYRYAARSPRRKLSNDWRLCCHPVDGIEPRRRVCALTDGFVLYLGIIDKAIGVQLSNSKLDISHNHAEFQQLQLCRELT